MARRARRTFTPEFKAKVVLDILTGAAPQAEVCRKQRISPSLLALWRATLLDRLPVVFQADEEHSAEAARVTVPSASLTTTTTACTGASSGGSTSPWSSP